MLDEFQTFARDYAHTQLLRLNGAILLDLRVSTPGRCRI